jgi:hypothetical protein
VKLEFLAMTNSQRMRESAVMITASDYPQSSEEIRDPLHFCG